MNVLRIQIASTGITWTTNYDFDDFEVEYVKIRPSVSSEVLISDIQYPSVQDKIKVNISANKDITEKIISVKIKHYYSTTEAKVQAVLQSSGMCKVYYKYYIDPLVSYTCLLLPGFIEDYYMGHKEVIMSELMFYQNSAQA
jgi:hypothetical protein